MATEKRLRHYLTRDEVTALLRAAKKTKRYGARNYAMILSPTVTESDGCMNNAEAFLRQMEKQSKT